jgi:hypothetical protein
MFVDGRKREGRPLVTGLMDQKGLNLMSEEMMPKRSKTICTKKKPTDELESIGLQVRL